MDIDNECGYANLVLYPFSIDYPTVLQGFYSISMDLSADSMGSMGFYSQKFTLANK